MLTADCRESAPIMPTTPPQYRLVIFEAIDEPSELRDLVCRVTGMHPTDAVQWLARAPGTWPQPLDETDGSQAAGRILRGRHRGRGVANRLVSGSEPAPDDSPGRLHEGRFRIEGLRAEPTHWVPWDRIELICAGRISAEDEFRNVQSPRWPSTVVSGIRALALMKPQPTSRHARASRIPRDPVGEVIIVRRDPRIAFRVVENQMNYAYLGERLSHSAADNFPVFLADSAPEPTRPTSPNRPARCWNIASPVSTNSPARRRFSEYATHRLFWSWYRRDRDAQSPSPDPRREHATPIATTSHDTDDDIEAP